LWTDVRTVSTYVRTGGRTYETNFIRSTKKSRHKNAQTRTVYALERVTTESTSLTHTAACREKCPYVVSTLGLAQKLTTGATESV